MQSSGNASSLQEEVAVIMRALAHATQSNGHVIDSDSRAPIDRLQHSMHSNIIYLLTTVLIILQKMIGQGSQVIINWIPSHIAIRGNVLANSLSVCWFLHPNRELLKCRVAAAGQFGIQQCHREDVRISP